MFTLAAATADTPARLRLDGDLTIYEVRAAREHILAGDFKEWKEAAVAKLGRRL